MSGGMIGGTVRPSTHAKATHRIALFLPTHLRDFPALRAGKLRAEESAAAAAALRGGAVDGEERRHGAQARVPAKGPHAAAPLFCVWVGFGLRVRENRVGLFPHSAVRASIPIRHLLPG